jgi:hypothetical protein
MRLGEDEGAEQEVGPPQVQWIGEGESAVPHYNGVPFYNAKQFIHDYHEKQIEMSRRRR